MIETDVYFRLEYNFIVYRLWNTWAEQYTHIAKPTYEWILPSLNNTVLNCLGYFVENLDMNNTKNILPSGNNPPFCIYFLSDMTLIDLVELLPIFFQMAYNCSMRYFLVYDSTGHIAQVTNNIPLSSSNIEHEILSSNSFVCSSYLLRKRTQLFKIVVHIVSSNECIIRELILC